MNLKKIGQKAWTNITISIEHLNFLIEYSYDDLSKSPYSNYERHIIWRYKYLQTDIHSYNRKEQLLIEKYFKEEKPNKKDVYNETIYTNTKKKNIIDFDTSEDIRKAKLAEEENKKIEAAKEKEMEINQIINMGNKEKKDGVHN